jgi:hypothetical protein
VPQLAIQTCHAPIDELSLVESLSQYFEGNVDWDDVGILTDQNNVNTVIILLQNNEVAAALRLHLTPSDSVEALQLLLPAQRTNFLYGYYQGFILQKGEIRSLADLTDIWGRISDQIIICDSKDILKYFQLLQEDSSRKGRNRSISAETKRKVLLFSHGRCMFEGCGEDLGIDQITGYDGNFSYLAHNIASAEKGERGGRFISEKLSDDPSNILLLCDKHHRLIDKVAGSDFPAYRLSAMRRSFKEVSTELLNGLGYEPIPCFSVLWPVGGSVIAQPTPFQISQSLRVIKYRPNGQLNVVTDNDESLLQVDDVSWKSMPKLIERAADRIKMQTQGSQHRAALFAFGFMPQLIGLGALLGNKAQFIPMLRSRDTGNWAWAAEKPRYEKPFISREELINAYNEVIVAVSLTAQPAVFDEISKSLGFPIIQVTVPKEFEGNGAIAHPEEGGNLVKELQSLFHRITDRGIKKIHLFICASNCASVLVGMAIDRNHAPVLVYDFYEKTLVPRLLIDPGKASIEISSPN